MTALTELAERKQSLRRESRARLGAFLRTDLKTTWDQRIYQFLEQIIPAQGGKGLAFSGLADEPQIADLLLQSKNWTWAWPRIEGDELRFHLPENASQWTLGPFNIKEPRPEAETVDTRSCQVACVPGLAFDRRGGRLGRGKGYYDRALQGFPGLKIGIGYSVQVMVDDVPTQSHDVRMDYIVTEKFILKPKG